MDTKTKILQFIIESIQKNRDTELVYNALMGLHGATISFSYNEFQDAYLKSLIYYDKEYDLLDDSNLNLTADQIRARLKDEIGQKFIYPLLNKKN